MAARRNVELLLLRIQVMELKSADPAPVTTKRTLTTSLLDQLPLDLAATGDDRFRPASLAPVMPTPLKPELSGAVTAALEQRGRQVAPAAAGTRASRDACQSAPRFSLATCPSLGSPPRTACPCRYSANALRQNDSSVSLGKSAPHTLGVGYPLDQGGAFAAEGGAALVVVGIAGGGDLGLEAALLQQ